jgi:hypothetical protein
MAGPNAAQQAILEQARASQAGGGSVPTATPVQQAPVESQRIRTFGQGLLFGFGDELEAAARSAFTGRDYNEVRDEIRQKIKAYQDANPGEALTMEVLGSIAPTAAAFLIPGAQPAAAAQAARTATSLGRLAAREAGMGAITGVGTSEQESLSGMATDAAIGGATSAVLAPITRIGTERLGGLASDVTNWIRTNAGSRPSQAAFAEIQRLAEGTGKTVDEIVQDIADGKIMAENRTLAAAVRAIRSKGDRAGSSPATITEGLIERRGRTGDVASQAVEKELGITGASSRNVFEAINAEDEALEALEKSGYKAVFGANRELAPELATDLREILKKYPNIQAELNQYYRESGSLVPLFKGDTGELARMPSLEDAEIAYRLLRDEAGALYQTGKGTRAGSYKTDAKSLKNKLDSAYPDLAETRAVAASRRSAKDAFADGRKAFGKDADEVQFEFDQLSKANPEAAKAYQAGVLAAFRNKMRRSQTVAGRAADPDRQEGAILKAVMGDAYEIPQSRQVGDAVRVTSPQTELATAGESAEAVQRIIYNSMTAPEAAATKAFGSGIQMSDLLMAYGGNPLAITAIVGQKIARSLNSSELLTPKDYEKITDILMSEDPDLVRRVLEDKIAMGDIIAPIKKVAPAIGDALEKSIRFQGAQESVEVRNPILGSLGISP